MRKYLALLLIFAFGLPLTACGESSEPQTAAEFCQEHGGVDTATEEPDGDATCMDGTEFEADEESSTSKKKKKSKSSSKSSSRSSSKRR